MTRALVRVLCIAATVLVATSAAALGSGQSTGGVLSGLVSDSGGPLPGALVSVTSPGLGQSRSVQTEATGEYRFSELPAGSYAVLFEMPGYRMTGTTAKVAAGQIATLDAQLAPAGTESAVSVTGAISVDSQVIPPRLLSAVAPVYPLSAKRLNRRGVVKVEATVDEEGRVVDARVISDEPGFGCGEAALAAVRQRVYSPATSDGVPVRVTLTVAVDFR